MSKNCAKLFRGEPLARDRPTCTAWVDRRRRSASRSAIILLRMDGFMNMGIPRSGWVEGLGVSALLLHLLHERA